MASKGVQAPSTGERKALTSVQVRESYHRRLDIHINEALDAYRSIVASCKVQDRVEGLRGDFQSQVDSSNFCKATEDVLRLISELKVASIVQEVTDAKQDLHESRILYVTEVKATERAISSLCESVLPTLEALEHHYYQSCTTWTKTSSSDDSNDNELEQEGNNDMNND